MLYWFSYFQGQAHFDWKEHDMSGINRQVDILIDRQADRQIDSYFQGQAQFDWKEHDMSDRQIDSLIDRQIDRQTGRFAQLFPRTSSL